MPDAIYDVLARSQRVRDFIANYQRSTGLSLVLIPANPQTPAPPHTPPTHPLCSLMARTKAGRELCRQSRARLQSRLRGRCKAFQMKCFCGLTYAAVPVVVGGQHVATLVGGRVFEKRPAARDVGALVRRLHAYGVATNPRQLRKACRLTLVYSSGQIRAARTVFEVFAQFLSDESNRWIITGGDSEPSCVRAAKDFISAHLAEPVTVHEVTRQVHLSADHFERIFKRARGITLTEHLTRCRVEKAKELLAASQARIVDVGYGSGFRSLPYFNRVLARGNRLGYPRIVHSACGVE